MVGVYFEVAAVIVALVLLGEWLGTHRARAHERGDPAAPGLSPRPPRRLAANGEEEDVPPNPSPSCDRLRVRPAKRSRSCRVVSGQSSVDESMLTGEPMPVRRASVIASWADDHQTGTLVIEAEHVWPTVCLSQNVALGE